MFMKMNWKYKVLLGITAPFLTSSRIRSGLGFPVDVLQLVLIDSSFFFHSDGAKGVALMEGSSSGRLEIPPSNCRKYN